MKQILTLTVTAFQEKLYVAFMLFVLNLIEEVEVIGEKFEYYVNQFKAAYNHLNSIYLKYDVRFYTEKVQDADKARILAYRSLRDRINYLVLYADSEATKEAARILSEIITLYGNAAKMKMNERTAVLINLIEDFESKYAEEVTAVGAGELLAALRTAQEEYTAAYMKRNEAGSQFALSAMVEARKLMTDAYRDFVEAVNLAAKRDEEGELDDFINRMNYEIRKNFIHTGQRPASAGGGTSSGSGSDSEGEEEVVTKAATFIFNNGTELKLWFVPGEPIEAPANTEGYRWDPEIPEAMPKRGKTFREVPIDPEEVTATFHFADHSEEEIKQAIGTALVAPENTPGYVWDPEVPEAMPAENTAYYELPEEEQGEQTEEEEGGDEHEGMFRIDYVFDGEILATQWYHEGDPIVEPEGLLPSGWIWGNTPGVMPARDIRVTAVEED